jgi:hypothetical protein
MDQNNEHRNRFRSMLPDQFRVVAIRELNGYRLQNRRECDLLITIHLILGPTCVYKNLLLELDAEIAIITITIPKRRHWHSAAAGSFPET